MRSKENLTRLETMVEELRERVAELEKLVRAAAAEAPAETAKTTRKRTAAK